MQAYLLIAESGGCSLVAMRGLLIAVASLVAEQGSRTHRREQLRHTGPAVVAPALWSTASIVVVHRLSCSVACGNFPDQGSNLCLLPWQVDSLPLSHQGSPRFVFDEDLVFGIERDINHNNMKTKLPLLSACHRVGTLEATQ